MVLQGQTIPESQQLKQQRFASCSQCPSQVSRRVSSASSSVGRADRAATSWNVASPSLGGERELYADKLCTDAESFLPGVTHSTSAPMSWVRAGDFKGVGTCSPTWYPGRESKLFDGQHASLTVLFVKEGVGKSVKTVLGSVKSYPRS